MDKWGIEYFFTLRVSKKDDIGIKIRHSYEYLGIHYSTYSRYYFQYIHAIPLSLNYFSYTKSTRVNKFSNRVKFWFSNFLPVHYSGVKEGSSFKIKKIKEKKVLKYFE